jgi:hypothetical protein
MTFDQKGLRGSARMKFSKMCRSIDCAGILKIRIAINSRTTLASKFLN